MRSHRYLFIALTIAAGGSLGACGDVPQDGGNGDVVGVAAELTTGTPTFDTGTQCTVTLPNGTLPTTMHCCPPGKAMVGIGANGFAHFKCASFPGVGSRFLDTGTQRTFTSNIAGAGSTTMHACPVGSVMVGFHGNLNRFACQSVLQSLPFTYRHDTAGADGMKTCTPGYAMAGFHASQFRLGCASDTAGPVIP